MSDCDEYALDLIEGLVRQHCRVEEGEVTSGFIGVNALAIDFLVAHGRMVLASDEEPYGRGRWAKWVKR